MKDHNLIRLEDNPCSKF